jgi:hypothetical protein
MTPEQRRAAIMAVEAVAQAIQELGSVPNGKLYAVVMAWLSHESYVGVIEALKKQGLVREQNNILTWIGPARPVLRG